MTTTTILDPVADPSHRRDRTQTPRLRLLASILFLLLAAWLLSPALTVTHVEAFSARMQTMAVMDLHGHLLHDDLAYPVDIEYFLTTRGGTIHLLEWIMRLTHTNGDLNFRLLIWSSFLLFVASSVVFVRRWSPEPVWAALAVLILTPGLTEISFFFADNLPSAALVTLALAVIGRRAPPWTWFAAGAAGACATLLRIDAIVATPSLLLLALIQQNRTWPRVIAQWFAALCGAALIFFVYWRATGISLAQSLAVGRMHNAIHNSWGDRQSPIRVAVLFFGPTLFLLALGVYALWKTRSLGWKLVMVAWPLLFYILFTNKAVQLRDYLLLGAPFVLLLGATGLTILLRWLIAGSSRQRLIAYAVTAIWVITLFAPPMLNILDGPRVFSGRIYTPPMWRRWQRNTDDAIQQLQTLAASTQPGQRTLILTTFFQSDRYLHLALLENGYTMLPLSANPSCGGVDTYQRNGATIFHIRTENPYWLLSAKPMSMPAEYVRAFQVHSGFQCLPPNTYDHAYMVTWGHAEQGYLQETPEFLRTAGPMEISFPQSGTPVLGKPKFLPVQRILPLSPSDVSHLTARTQDLMSSYEAGNNGAWRQPQTYADFHTQAEPLVLKSLTTIDQHASHPQVR